LRVRSATDADLAAIRRIYNEGIADRIATLDEDPKTEDDIAAWFSAHAGRYAVLVAEDENGSIAGWASLNPYSHRCAYNGVADLSIYIARERRGNGIGSSLLRALEKKAKENTFHKIVLFTFAFNASGQGLYRKLGYREVGVFHEQGRLDGAMTRDEVLAHCAELRYGAAIHRRQGRNRKAALVGSLPRRGGARDSDSGPAELATAKSLESAQRQEDGTGCRRRIVPDLNQVEGDHVKRASQSSVQEEREHVGGEKARDAEERERHHRIGLVRLGAEEKGEEDDSTDESRGYQVISPAELGRKGEGVDDGCEAQRRECGAEAVQWLRWAAAHGDAVAREGIEGVDH